MGRPPSIPAEKKTRIVLSVIAGELTVAEAEPLCSGERDAAEPFQQRPGGVDALELVEGHGDVDVQSDATLLKEPAGLDAEQDELGERVGSAYVPGSVVAWCAEKGTRRLS